VVDDTSRALTKPGGMHLLPLLHPVLADPVLAARGGRGVIWIAGWLVLLAAGIALAVHITRRRSRDTDERER
jgi:hypothetical protein